ncbi:4'-phosphopantetheinyl transferase family protein [Flavobacterium hydatis]|uniref:Phosphopantetheinyl transferase n=1 Tax=Flavobacterium hydatis TaxID=991 RepID=A0A086AEG2_FLAHY|nr:4'-phosphopantetheinyl transferase superfamily protein [Flavobacterium hydatis]KFF15076.1 phosphopantetheinyl transferase [Flavobacterium hydatis]OXA91974.1 phosphopantetheinyl transferase [Flavobacterium hydatis]
MIGNDIIDLKTARQESNWKRKGFLDKIFTPEEQFLILNSEKPEIMVWNLWSRKEAAYKIYNRETKISGYFPTKLVCFYESANSGTVTINNTLYYTKTVITEDCIDTIAVAKKNDLNKIAVLDNETKIYKDVGIPYIIDAVTKFTIPVSVSHHGRFIKTVRIK